jgi:hypothetical protein
VPGCTTTTLPVSNVQIQSRGHAAVAGDVSSAGLVKAQGSLASVVSATPTAAEALAVVGQGFWPRGALGTNSEGRVAPVWRTIAPSGSALKVVSKFRIFDNVFSIER